MANTIIPKRSSIAARVPLATDLQVGELAVNLADALIYTKNALGTVITINAARLQTGRTIGMTGDVTWTSGAFDGSGNVTGVATLANSGVTAGSYGSSTAVPVITVDAKGRVTSVSSASISGALTFTGDVTGSGTTGANTALTLANSGVTAGTYTKVTVDAKGRVTTGAALASSDLPTYTGSLTSGQVTTALGFTPYNSTNPNGYITSSANITGSSASVAGTNLGKTGSQGFFTTTAWTAADWANLAIGGGGMAIANTPGAPNTNYGYFIKVGNRDAGGPGWGGVWLDYQGGDFYFGNTTTSSNFATWYKLAKADGSNTSGTWGISISGSAATLTTGRTIGMTGDVTWTSGSFNGSANVTGTATLANSGVTAGTYSKVTVDAKGRVTSGASLASSDLPTYTGAITSSQVTSALGFTPYNSTNPSGYITQDGNARIGVENNGTLIGTRRRINFIAGSNVTLNIADDAAGEEVDVTIGLNLSAAGVSSFNGRAGVVTLSSGDVTSALGFTPLSNAGDTITGPLVVSTGALNNNYNEGIRLTRASNSWTGITFGSTGATGAPTGGWFAATNPSAQFIISPDDSQNTTGLTLNKNGNALWRNSVILHAGNYNSYSPTLTGGGASGTWSINVTGNAGTATTLQNARTINGISFNGSANIKTTEWFHSDRDFASGTLVTTDINYGVTNGDPFILEIRGNSYGDAVPYDIQYQGYIYSDTIINHGGYSNGTNISGLVALNVGGNLCFWWPRQSYWNGFNVRVYTAYATYAVNRVTSITSTAKPSGTKEVGLSANIRQSLHSSNYTNYAPSLTGAGASGTWGINVTGSAASLNLSGHTISNSSWAGGGGYHGYQFNGGNWRFGFSSTGGVVDVYADGNFYATDSSHLVLHAGNYSSYALPLSGGTISGNGVIDFGPNSGWGATLRVGGNGHTGASRASVVTTNGNLHLDGSTNNGTYLNWYNSGTTGTFFGNGAGGQVGRIDGAGNATFSGNTTASSDERLKTNWASVSADFIERLAEVKSGTYTRIDGGARQAGSSAQDWQRLLPEVVMVGDDEAKTLSLAYGNAALVSAIELAKRVVEQEARIKRLESLITTLIGDHK